MYIGGVQAGLSQSATTALGESKALTWDELTKAATMNRRYVRHIGWMPYARQIAQALGVTDPNPDIWRFIQAVADWQARNMKKPNGFFGGGEWYDLLTKPRP